MQVKRLRERLKQASRREESVLCNYARPQVKQSDVFLTQLNALTSPRNIRTRRLAQAEDNPELTRTARLAYVLRDLYNIVIAAKGMSFLAFIYFRVTCNPFEYIYLLVLSDILSMSLGMMLFVRGCHSSDVKVTIFVGSSAV